MLAEGLFALIKADSGIAAIMGTRTDGTTGIFAGQAPEGSPLPLIIFGGAYEENEMTMDGPDPFTRSRFEFSTQGNTYLQAKKLARALRKCLENFTGTLSDGSDVDSMWRTSELDIFQDKPFLYSTSVEFQVSFRDIGT
jgi:hypothetical protein